jgi:undecaprenyl diphosphate synthase
MAEKKKEEKITPKHIAFIVDGNRRWARKQGLSIVAGHRKVALNTIDEVVNFCFKNGVRYVTFWAFSTENWKRGDKFAKLLWGILKEALAKNTRAYSEKGIRFNTIGDLSRLPQDLVEKIEKLKSDSKELKEMTVTVALNYGGRDEIVRGIIKMIQKEKLTPDTADSVSQEMFAKYLDTRGLPDVDLVVRTGGDQRTSGFLPWQTIYSELCFTKTLFPDLGEKELGEILAGFANRDRRFGGDSKKT